METLGDIYADAVNFGLNAAIQLAELCSTRDEILSELRKFLLERKGEQESGERFRAAADLGDKHVGRE